MVVLRSSAAGTGSRVGVADYVRKGNGMELKMDAHKKNSGLGMVESKGDDVAATDTASMVATKTVAERKLLAKAERVAAEFDVSTERLDACVAEFVREMGMYDFPLSPFLFLHLCLFSPGMAFNRPAVRKRFLLYWLYFR